MLLEINLVITQVVLDVLGDILYWPHTDHVDVRGNADSNNPLKEFPSPEELKGRVLLLSTKLPPASPIIKKEDVKMVCILSLFPCMA